MRIVIVGGVAGGMSTAARLRRLDESAEIIILERGEDVSFANCGLPYHVADEIVDRSALLLHTPESLRASLALDVRTRSEVISVDTRQKTVVVREVDLAHEYELHYDALVLATGAEAIVPPIPGVDHPAIRTLRTVPDADVLRRYIDDGATRAVVIGAGFIGLEVVEAFVHRGLDVTLVELAPAVLPAIDVDMARLVEAELVRHGVEVLTGVAASAFESRQGSEGVDVVLTDGRRIPADVVLMGVGVRPSTGLAREAGLLLSERGAIIVDQAQRTSDPNIWAVGDATQVIDAITGQPAVIPLAGPANRQGRTAANSICGRPAESASVMGTAIVRVFDLTAAVTGHTSRVLDRAGVPHHVIHLHPNDHAGYYPGAEPIHLSVIFGHDGRLLGAQAVGGSGVDKRIDVIATAIRANMRVTDLAELELAYAPPFGSAKDPINMAGFIAENVLDGTLVLWRGQDLLGEAVADHLLLDVRSRDEYAAGHIPGAMNIPHTELRDRLDDVIIAAAGRPVWVYCASGFRSYLAHRILSGAQIDSASLDGGLQTFLAGAPQGADAALVSELQLVS
jgi:NADPH-dependent 2,4-dienoyl-CoA reductase/sulfur reductase-like enzyme/rhodanese-related sulfurtransferase